MFNKCSSDFASKQMIEFEDSFQSLNCSGNSCEKSAKL